MLKLQTLEMTYGIAIHVVHIFGKRMIPQGIDGYLGGLLMEGVIAGVDMLTFIDLPSGGINHHPPLLEWVRLWLGHPSLKALTPEG